MSKLNKKLKLSFEFNPRTYDFSSEFLTNGRKLKKYEAESIVNFLNFFNSLSDKSPFKDDILYLASFYSDEKS